MKSQEMPLRRLGPLLLSFTVVLAAPGRLGAATALTAAECEAFGRDIEKHSAQGDFAFLFDAYDWNAILERAIPPKMLSAADYAEFQHGLRKSQEERAALQARAYVAIKFLRAKPVGREMRALCRFEHSNSGFTHQELILEHRRDGRPGVADSYLYYSGEKLSDTIRHAVMPILAEKDKSVLERMFSDTPDLLKSAPVWNQLVRLSLQGRSKEVLSVYNRLPPSVQKEKFMLIYRLKAAQAVDDKEYLAAMDLWRRTYPNDPSLDVITLDAHILRKEYPQALECINRLDKALGGDPYLELQRAYLYTLMNDGPKARAAAQRCLEAEPSRLDAGMLVLSSLAQEHQDDECIAWLDKMQSTGGHSKEQLIERIETSEKLGQFSISEAYRKWRGPRSRPSQLVIDKSQNGVTPSRGLKLQSVVFAGSGSSATINGRYLVVGDSIGEYKVLAIDAESVTLQSESGEKKVLHVGETLEPVRTRAAKQGLLLREKPAISPAISR